MSSRFSELTLTEQQRKENEKQMVRDGMALLSRRKVENLQQKLHEQEKLRYMMEKYAPWGKPGGGAPTSNIRMRNIRDAELIPDDENQKEAANRRFEYRIPHRVPPMKYKPKVLIREDPDLRFSNVESVRRDVENRLRYQVDKQEQAKYRRQLDKIVAEQKRARDALERDKHDFARQLAKYSMPWGRSGPGGRPWRPPPNIGSNFFDSLGWTTEDKLKAIERENFRSGTKKAKGRGGDVKEGTKSVEQKVQEGTDGDDTRQSTSEVTGGVELVPLLARRREAQIRLPLPSTDITRIEYHPRWKPADSEYLKELSHQVTLKSKHLKEIREQDSESSRKHFETWQSFWGKPGHGAPRTDCNQKRRLYTLLYQQPPAVNS